MADLYINGSSFASGWGKGYDDTMTITPLDSWAKYFKESFQPENAWIDAIVGKSIGMTARDTITFCEKYKEKYGSLDNLNVVLEFTTPRYRHWSALNTVDGKSAYPIAHIRHDNMNATQHYFMRREFIDNSLTYADTFVHEEEIVPAELEKWKQDLNKWYFGGWPIQHFMAYATEEISATQKYLNENNVNYVMWWCVGRTRLGKTLVERYTRTLYRKARMVKPSQMNGHEVAETVSLESYKGHPDAKGHKYIADFLLKHIEENNLFGANNG